MDNPYIITWLILGAVLVVSELFIPGGVVIFLGVSALLIAGLYTLGISISILDSIFIWLAISIFFVLVIRRFFKKFWPSEEKNEESSFSEMAIGKLVRVVKRITPENSEGRIFHAGTSWPARSEKDEINEDEYAKILYRDGTSWIVEKTGKKITEDLWEI